MSLGSKRYPVKPICPFVLVVLFSVFSLAQNSGSSQNRDSDLYAKIRLNLPLKVSKLEPNDEISGTLLQDVYSGTAEVFPASSVVHLTVDRLDRRRRAPNDHWPWVIKVFTRRHEKYPVFRSMTIDQPDGHQAWLPVSLISITNEVQILPKRKKHAQAASSGTVIEKSRRTLGPIATVLTSTEADLNNGLSSGTTSIPSGTEAKVILLRDVSASKDHAGDTFQASLVEPIRIESKIVIPEGSIFDGKVVKSQAPRTLSRSGSIHLTFTNLTVPGNTNTHISASLAGAEISQRSHTVIDPEGHLHGDRPGKVWMLLNVGTTAGIAKEVDDGTQLVIEALVSTATDASTAGAARIVSTCVSGIFMLTRHGRDVVLPKYTQLKIVFDRDVKMN